MITCMFYCAELDIFGLVTTDQKWDPILTPVNTLKIPLIHIYQMSFIISTTIVLTLVAWGEDKRFLYLFINIQ